MTVLFLPAKLPAEPAKPRPNRLHSLLLWPILSGDEATPASVAKRLPLGVHGGPDTPEEPPPRPDSPVAATRAS